VARRYLLLLLLPLCAGFDAATGRGVVAERPLESMVRIPAGEFLMGATVEAQAAAVHLCREELRPRQGAGCKDDAFVGEGPPKRVFLSEFFIDRVEVTVEAWRRCAQAGACSPEPLLQPDRRFLAPTLPITSVTWDEAARYCAWRGGRLPTEAEWERAARGTDGRTWPWGSEPRGDRSNHGRFYTVGELGPQPEPVLRPDASDGFALLAPVGSFPEGASPEGVLDLAGNAMEWTADVFIEEPPQKASQVNPRGPLIGSTRTVRGGSWRQPRLYQRTTARDAAPPDTRSPEIGFRCAR
jgi:formylglycine-generating enzyme required for sulfatase activity